MEEPLIFNIPVAVDKVTGDDRGKRYCDFCHQPGRQAYFNSTFDNDRDICNVCVLLFANSLRTSEHNIHAKSDIKIQF